MTGPATVAHALAVRPLPHGRAASRLRVCRGRMGLRSPVVAVAGRRAGRPPRRGHAPRPSSLRRTCRSSSHAFRVAGYSTRARRRGRSRSDRMGGARRAPVFTTPPPGPRAGPAHGFPQPWAACRGILARRRPRRRTRGDGERRTVPGPAAHLQGFTAGFEDASTSTPRHGAPGPSGHHPAGRRIPNNCRTSSSTTSSRVASTQPAHQSCRRPLTLPMKAAAAIR